MAVVFLRTCVLYIIIVFSLRIMGKRQIGELQPSEFVITILISNIATLPIEDTNIPLVAGLLPILTLVTFEVMASALSLKSKAARKIISGTPRVVIRDGVIDQQELRNLRFSIDDLLEQLRISNVFDVREVAFAIVETTGKVSVYQRYSNRNVTPEVLGLPNEPAQDFPQVTVISDGAVIYPALKAYNLREEWLKTVLEREGWDLKEVFLMTANPSADYHIVPKERFKNKKRRKKEADQ